jgi:tetratricopeptide (TPR) repeat protein
MLRASIFCLVCLIGTPSLAQSNPSLEQQRREQAQKLFFAAEEEYALGNYEAALVGYDQAYLLTQEPLLLFNQAQCYRQLKRYQEALDAYQLFLEKMPDERTYVPKAKEWLEAIQSETGLAPSRPIQPVTTRPADLKEPNTLPKPLLVEPPPATNSPSTASLFLYSSIGAGVAWAGFGIGAIATARSARTLQSTPTDNNNAANISEQLQDRRQSARTLGTLSDIALVGSAAAAAGYLYLHSKEKKLSASITTQSISLSVRF